MGEQATYRDGVKDGLEHAAHYLESQPDDGVSYQKLWRLAREIRGLGDEPDQDEPR